MLRRSTNRVLPNPPVSNTRIRVRVTGEMFSTCDGVINSSTSDPIAAAFRVAGFVDPVITRSHIFFSMSKDNTQNRYRMEVPVELRRFMDYSAYVERHEVRGKLDMEFDLLNAVVMQ